MHSSMEQDLIDEFRVGLVNSLRSAPPLPQAYRQGFRDLNKDLIEQFRSAMRATVRSGANLAASEVELLGAMDLEKLGEFRSQLSMDLENDPEISQEDLAIYVPAGFGLADEFRRGLALRPAAEVEPEGIDATEISVEPERRPAKPYAPGAYIALENHAADQELDHQERKRRPIQLYVPGAYVDRMQQQDREELPTEEPAAVRRGDDPKRRRPDAVASLRAGLEGAEAPPTLDTGGMPAADAPSAYGLTAVPTLTAALEAIGSKGDDFGFVVRYGRYAPEGRRSEFLVGGLGFSELSKRLTSWLQSHASLDDQVQVIDEGSGELTLYLLGAEKQN